MERPNEILCTYRNHKFANQLVEMMKYPPKVKEIIAKALQNLAKSLPQLPAMADATSK